LILIVTPPYVSGSEARRRIAELERQIKSVNGVNGAQRIDKDGRVDDYRGH